MMWLGFQALLLFSTFLSSTLARTLFERQQCAVPCGSACGLTGDICCTTPAGNPNLCGYGTTCCFDGCCNFGSTCQPDGSCLAPGGSQTGNPGGPASGFTTITTVSGGQTLTLTSATGAPGGGSGTATGVTTITTVSAGQTITLTSILGGSPPASTTVLPDGQTVTSESGVLVWGTNTVTIPTGVNNPTTVVTDGETFTFGPTQVLPTSAVVTQTLPDGVTVTSSGGNLIWSGFTVPVPTGLSTTAIVTTDGETFTFLPTVVPPNPTQTGVSIETLPDGVTVTSSNGNLIWSGFTLPVPTGLSTTAIITTDGETFTFLPTILPPNPTQTGVSTETLPGGVLVTSSGGNLIWSGFTVPVPTGLSTTETVTTDGQIFTFLPTVNGGGTTTTGTTTATTTATGVLTTFTTWPAIVSIIPVTTSVPGPQSQDNKPVIPCKVWFFFICISWNLPDLNIFGWQLGLPPGIYPPGPPPGLKFPPGFNLPGPLPPWPPITIGNDGVPTYSDEPSSCQTETATMFLTTSSYGVSASTTTTTQVLSTSSTLLGCDIQNQATTTATTSVCTATTCSSAIVVTLTNDPVNWPTAFPSDAALVASVYSYVQSLWSDLDATTTTDSGPTNLPTLTTTTTGPPTTLPIQTSTGSSCVSTVTTSICTVPQQPCVSSLSCASWTATSTVQPPTTTTQAAPTPTSTWILDMYDAACDKQGAPNFDYYSLEGTGGPGRNEVCISLQHGSDPSFDCEWFTAGGANPAQPCSAGTFTKPTSFAIRNGFCTLYTNDGCTGYPNGIDSSEYTGCTDFSSTIDLPLTWLSMQCFAYNAS